MITCNLMGGLGNQLFQIFTTISYSIKTNNPFVFLNIYQLGGGVTTIRYTYWNSFLKNLNIFLINEIPLGTMVIKENGFTYNNFPLNRIMNKNIIFFESIFTDKVGSYINIIGDTFINEKIDLNNQYFKEKTEIINGIKKFIIDILQTDFDETNVSYEYADTIFNLMCSKDFIKNEKLFDIFFHDNYYVRDNVKKIVRQ